MKKFAGILLAVTLLLVVATPASAAPAGGRHVTTGVIYVQTQDLYYEVITPIAPGQNGVPWKYENQNRPWQLLVRPGDIGYTGSGYPETEFGPGDPGYLGGRWWIDVNQDTYQDAGDIFFICPLLGPGQETPQHPPS